MLCHRIHHTGKSLLPNCNSLDSVCQPMVCERLAGHENDQGSSEQHDLS